MRGFWNSLTHRKCKNIPSKLAADDLANHFRLIMQDSSDLNTEQTEIRDIVSGMYRDVADRYIDAKVTCSTIHTLIKALRPDASPGWDGITPGHLIHANTPSPCAKLSDIFSVVVIQ